MSGAHGHRGIELVAAGDSPVHRLDPRGKTIGLIGLVLVAVTTPPGAWPAYAAYAAVLAALVLLARLPLRHVALRMTVEVPFLLAAALLPFTVEDGVTLGATVAAKATIGVLAMVLLSSTTPFPRLLAGFERLRVPPLLTAIIGVMWRYLHVLGEDVRRMRIAREARGYQGRWLWQAGAVAAGLAALFIRSLERGERVHLAMVSRGFRGTMPATVTAPLSLGAGDVVFLAALAVAAVAIRTVLA